MNRTSFALSLSLALSLALTLTFLLATSAFAQEQAAPPPADTNAAAPVPQAVTPAPANPAMTGPRILIATSMGDITLQLASVRAPKSVANVLRHVKEQHSDYTAL